VQNAVDETHNRDGRESRPVRQEAGN